MLKRVLLITLSASFLLLVKENIFAGKLIWNKETGWIEADKLTTDSLDHRYRYALALITDQQYLPAIRELEDIIKEAPDSEFAVPAMFNIAYAYSLADDLKKAFKTYETLLLKYPGTRRTREIIEKQYNLGISQMESLEVKSAIDMFEKIIEHNPKGPFAADAQIKIADCYLKLKKFDDAIENYEKLIENYRDSAWVGYAKFQIPLCKMEEERRQARNYGLLSESEEGFEDYIANNPQGPLAEDAKKRIKDINTAKGEREFNVAEFYLRRKRPKAAKVYYELVVTDFPDTVWAAKATEKLEFLRGIGAIE